MKLPSTAVVFFCLVIIQTRALNFMDKRAPKILIDIQVRPEYDLRNEDFGKLLGRYLSRYFQRRDSRQVGFEDEVYTLVNLLNTMNPIVNELNAITATDSRRGIDLGNMVDKIKQDVQNIGQSVGLNVRNRMWRNICTEFDERPECNLASF